ncbi:FAD-binding protein [Terricaulis silvestris]|uniref:3-oxo-5-alpha-steroid 4-dehydrogenase n=1 Tax=Terricaulis silvestris TaxID=2686094 RepID=A0A6I6MKP4_9CAUL|nr:FAD-binding protein [Terricaulis silvestris]QGZ93798.1 3-oxo-5-alpha-steroid 4-dehydrogenase [Terricaulis silvestris]
MTPITVGAAEDVDWDDSADVVIVGYGGAGACAALSARENGADVLIVDRFGGGGTTAFSGGVIYAGGTRFQREAGYEDNAQQLRDYLAIEVGQVVKPETLARFCEGSAADVEWLVSHGVEYASDVFLEKTTFPPEGKYLYFSGNEKTPANAVRTPPIPRGHRAVGAGYGGQYYFAALSKAVDRSGVRVRRHEKASSLVVDRAGRVVGVEVMSVPEAHRAEHQALHAKASPSLPHNNKAVERLRQAAIALEEKVVEPKRIRARRGVVLTTGGFTFNQDMLRGVDPSFARHYLKLHNLATLGNDGAGVALGQSAGGAIGRMDQLYIARNIAPPEAAVEGVMVNQEGRRFVNEDAYTSAVGGAIAKQSDCRAWLILSPKSFWTAVRQAMFCGWHRFKFFGLPSLINFALGGTKRASSIRGIARACGVNEAALRATLSAHDRAIAEQRTDPGGKNEAYCAPMGEGPFYAISMSLSNGFALTPFMTLGGLKVDEETGAVVREDGAPVAGLYAAGLCAVGLHSNGYISGISLADGVFSGRRAGRSCALSPSRAGHPLPETLPL